MFGLKSVLVYIFKNATWYCYQIKWHSYGLIQMILGPLRMSIGIYHLELAFICECVHAFRLNLFSFDYDKTYYSQKCTKTKKVLLSQIYKKKPLVILVYTHNKKVTLHY